MSILETTAAYLGVSAVTLETAGTVWLLGTIGVCSTFLGISLYQNNLFELSFNSSPKKLLKNPYIIVEAVFVFCLIGFLIYNFKKNLSSENQGALHPAREAEENRLT